MKTQEELKDAADKAWEAFEKAGEVYSEAWDAYVDARELEESYDRTNSNS